MNAIERRVDFVVYLFEFLLYSLHIRVCLHVKGNFKVKHYFCTNTPNSQKYYVIVPKCRNLFYFYVVDRNKSLSQCSSIQYCPQQSLLV